MEAPVDPEWSAWFYKAEWKNAWGKMPDSTFRRLVKRHGETNPDNKQQARFPIQWLKQAGNRIPPTED